MNINFDYFEQLVKSAFLPVVLVVTTEDVEASCSKNGKNLIDLLRPYCSFPDEIVTIKGIREEPYQFTGFQIKLVQPSELKLTSSLEQSTDIFLNATTRKNIPSSVALRYGEEVKVGNRVDALTFTQNFDNSKSNNMFPWFEKYQEYFIKNMGVSEHEFFGHPVACKRFFFLRTNSPTIFPYIYFTLK